MKALLICTFALISLIISIAGGPGGIFTMAVIASIGLSFHIANRCRGYTRR